MAGIRLYTRRLGPGPGLLFYRPEDRSGTVHHIPLTRVFVKLFVLPHDASDRSPPSELPDRWSPEAILDTGSPLTIFPFAIWQPFRDVVQWLDQPPDESGRNRVTILGGRFAFRLGRLRFGVTDEEGNWLPAVWSNAWLLEDDPAAPRQAVLGLRTRLFDKRQLRCEEVPADVFGQLWRLEDS